MLDFLVMDKITRDLIKEAARTNIVQEQAIDAIEQFDAIAGHEGSIAEGSVGKRRHKIIDKLKQEYGATFTQKGGTEAILNDLADYLTQKIGDPQAKTSLAKRKFTFNDSKEIRKYKTALRAILDDNPEAPYGYALNPGAGSRELGGKRTNLREVLAYFWLAATDENMPLDKTLESNRADCISGEKENVVEFLADLRREYSKITVGHTSVRVNTLSEDAIKRLSSKQKREAAVDRASCPPGQFGRITAMGLSNQHSMMAPKNPILTVAEDAQGYILRSFEKLSAREQFDVATSINYIALTMSDIPSEISFFKEFIDNEDREDMEKYFPQFMLEIARNTIDFCAYIEDRYQVKLSEDERTIAMIALLEKTEEITAHCPDDMLQPMNRQSEDHILDGLMRWITRKSLTANDDELFLNLKTIYQDLSEINQKLVKLAAKEITNDNELREVEAAKLELIDRYMIVIKQKKDVLVELQTNIRKQFMEQTKPYLEKIVNPIEQQVFKDKRDEMLAQVSLEKLSGDLRLGKAIDDLEAIESNCHLAIGTISYNQRETKLNYAMLKFKEYISGSYNAFGVQITANALIDAVDKFSEIDKLDLLTEGMRHIEAQKRALLDIRSDFINDFYEYLEASEGIKIDSESMNALYNNFNAIFKDDTPIDIEDILNQTKKAEAFYAAVIYVKSADVNDVEYMAKLSAIKKSSPAMAQALIANLSEEDKAKLKQIETYNSSMSPEIKRTVDSLLAINYFEIGKDASLAGRTARDNYVKSLQSISSDKDLITKILYASSVESLKRLKESLDKYKSSGITTYQNSLMPLVMDILAQRAPGQERRKVNLSSFHLQSHPEPFLLSQEEIKHAQSYLNQIKNNSAEISNELKGHLTPERIAEVQAPKSGDKEVTIIFKAIKQGDEDKQLIVPIDKIKHYASLYKPPTDSSALFATLIEHNLLNHYHVLGQNTTPEGSKMREKFIYGLCLSYENNIEIFKLILKSQTLIDLNRLTSSLAKTKLSREKFKNPVALLEKIKAAVEDQKNDITKDFGLVKHHDRDEWDKNRAEIYMEKAKNIMRVDRNLFISATTFRNRNK